MDPYKVLQLPPTADLEACRQKAKVLYKRYAGQKNGFDSKKVLEAFEMVKRAQKPSEIRQVIGRSRKERELDGLFNRQTKKMIKKKKSVEEKKRLIAREMKRRGVSGSRRNELMRHYRSIRGKKKSSRRRRPTQGCAPPPKKPREGPTDPLDALYKVVQHLPNEKKFPFAIPLLYRWITEVMQGDVTDSKEHLFYALQTAMDSGHIVSTDVSLRMSVLQVFRYVLKQPWFDTPEEKRLRDVWDLCVVKHNECHTDDAFELNSLIGKLTEVLMSFPTEDERDQRELVEAGPSPSPQPSPSPSSSPYPSPQPSPEPQRPGPSVKAEGPVGPAPPVKAEPVGPEPASPRGVKRSRGDWDAASIDSASDAGADDAVSVGSNEDCASDGSEASEQAIWHGPTEDEAEDMRLVGFVDCLKVLATKVTRQWAKAAVANFFTAVYLERTRVPEPLRTEVANMQAELRRKSKEKEGFFDTANSILEAKHAVVDGREDRMSMAAGSDAWAAKQFGLIERI